jgi:two-component system cell cycle response regulator DivK
MLENLNFKSPYITGGIENMAELVSILYVEDDPLNRILIQRVLNAEGYDVTFAEDATEALEHLTNKDYKLILMDINLPDIDGYSLTTRLRQNPKYENTPIVALTANVMKGDRERSLESGCDGYIQKPIDVDALPSQIRVFLQR